MYPGNDPQKKREYHFKEAKVLLRHAKALHHQSPGAPVSIRQADSWMRKRCVLGARLWRQTTPRMSVRLNHRSLVWLHLPSPRLLMTMIRSRPKNCRP